MSQAQGSQINLLRLTLHGRLVGYLAGFLDGRNLLSFADEFLNDIARPTFSLITHPRFPHAEKLIAEPWARSQRCIPPSQICCLRVRCAN